MNPLNMKKLIKNTLAFVVFVIALTGSQQLFTFQDALAAEAICNRGDILLCEDWEWSTSTSFVAAASDWTAHSWSLGESLPTYPNNNVYCNSIGYNSKCSFQTWMNSTNPGAVQFPDHSIPPQQGPTYARVYLKFSNNYQFGQYTECCLQKLMYFRADDSNGNLQWRVQIGITSRNANWDTYNYASSACPVPEQGVVDKTKGRIAIDTNVHVNEYFQSNVYNEGTFVCGPAIQPDPRPLVYFDRGNWHSIEFMTKPNTPGQANGAVALWFDGKKIIDRPNVDVGSNGTPINNFWITAYSGDTSLTAPQQIWYDNIVVSTHYIGPVCFGPSSLPCPPTGITVK